MNKQLYTTMSLVTMVSLFVVSIPSEGFAARRGYDGCYESSSICADIEELGEDPEEEFPNPIMLDVHSSELQDTWGEARSSGNSHEGTDIIAPRGSLIVMPVDGVVDRTGVSGLGGNHVFVYIAGGEKLYFAHLDDWAEGLSDGDVLEKGDLVGYVGNTGAEYTSPHLHFAIYKDNVADNPFPRMEDEDWTLKQKMKSLDAILDEHDDADILAQELYSEYTSLFSEAIKKDIVLPSEIKKIISKTDELAEDIADELIEELEKTVEDALEDQADEQAVQDSDTERAKLFDTFDVDVSVSTTNTSEVERLQEFLNEVEDADIEENGKFDQATVEAVRDFQNKYKKQILDIWGLDEATGYVGITTRLKINFLIQSENNQCPAFTQYNSRTTNPHGSEVASTEELLKNLGFFSGTPDQTWDNSTHQAMITFQEKFKATMLTPWGISRGTGYKYKTTNKFMNYLVGCDTESVYLEGKGEFDF